MSCLGEGMDDENIWTCWTTAQHPLLDGSYVLVFLLLVVFFFFSDLLSETKELHPSKETLLLELYIRMWNLSKALAL